MGYIICKSIPELHRREFKAFPTRPKAGIKILRYGHILVGVGLDGTLYTDHRVCGKGHHPMGHPTSICTLLEALIRLRVVSQDSMDDYMRIVKERERRSEARHFLQFTVPDLQKTGFKLTKAQHNKLVEASK